MKRFFLVGVLALVAFVVGGFFAAREVAQSSDTVGTSGLMSPAPSALWEPDIRDESPSFSVAGGATGADILNRGIPPPANPPPTAPIPCPLLGLGPAGTGDCQPGIGRQDDVDGLSYGYDFTWPMKPYWKWLFFSVAPGAQGLAGSAVATEAACSPAEPQADEFWSSAQAQLNTNGQYYDGNGTACNPAQSNPYMGLSEPSGDLDALDEYPAPGGPGGVATPYIFFTLKTGSWSLGKLPGGLGTTADILVKVPGNLNAPLIYATANQLGLNLAGPDQIDALCLRDYDDVYGDSPNDKLWFSLKAGSATLTSALPNYTGGDILAPAGAGVRPVLAKDGQGNPIDHTRLGLAATDDLDALKCAQIADMVDKQVTDIVFDVGTGYPYDGKPLDDHPTKHLPYVEVATSEERVISVTSVDVNLSSTEVDDALAAFYADIPLGCQGRWYDQGNGGPWFTHDAYSVGGDPDATPFSAAQLGEEDTQPLVKKPGDSDPAYPNNTYEVDLHFQTGDYGTEYVEEAGSTVFITRFFDLQCPTPGQYHFWFCNKIEPKDYIDPILTNNVWCEEMVVESTGAAVGGIAELPEVAGGAGDQAAAPDNGSGWSSANYAALAGGLAAAVVVLSAGAWYARRRFSRS